MKKLLYIILFLCFCLPAFGQFNDSEKMFGQQLNLGHWSTDGLVGYWRFIEAGNLVDTSLFDNDGTITGPTWAGDGLSFDGFEDIVSISGVPIKNQGTIAVWLKVNLTSGHTDDIGANPSLTIVPYVINERIGAKIGSSFLTVLDIEFDEWFFYIVTWDNGSYFFSINGNESTESGGYAGSVTTGNGFVLGSASAFNGINGFIRDVKIYNRALSALEIQALYINPDLPVQQKPIWLLFSPEEAPSGIVPIIQAHTRRRRAG